MKCAKMIEVGPVRAELWRVSRARHEVVQLASDAGLLEINLHVVRGGDLLGPGVRIECDTDQVIANMEETGSLTPGLNWYRANLPPESWVDPPPMLPPVQAPTMGIWSTKDVALTEAQMTDSAENVTGPWRYERLTGPGHWMQREAPEQVNALLLDFLPTP